LIDAGGGMVRPSRDRELPLTKNRGGMEAPISAVWHVVGRPSDLTLVQLYAKRLGVSISWEQNKRDRESTVVLRGEEASRGSE